MPNSILLIRSILLRLNKNNDVGAVTQVFRMSIRLYVSVALFCDVAVKSLLAEALYSC